MSCSICAKDSDIKYHPFCTRRCADIDLGRWLKESYFLPGSDSDEAPASNDQPTRQQ